MQFVSRQFLWFSEFHDLASHSRLDRLAVRVEIVLDLARVLPDGLEGAGLAAGAAPAEGATAAAAGAGAESVAGVPSLGHFRCAMWLWEEVRERRRG